MTVHCNEGIILFSYFPLVKPKRHPKSRSSIVAGCDEVGRGCLAGPVVAAAVVLPRRKIHPFLQDSKSLNASQIKEVATWIRENSLDYGIGVLNATEIDKINILQASLKAMRMALAQLNPQPEYILVDGHRFDRYENIPHECVVKGDAKYLSIAAGSILAKDYRDRLMESLDQLYPDYHWSSNVGYPTPYHKKTLQEIGHTPFHRLSFKGVVPVPTLFDSDSHTDVNHIT